MKIRYEREVPDGDTCYGCGKLHQWRTGPVCGLWVEDCGKGAVKIASCVAAEVRPSASEVYSAIFCPVCGRGWNTEKYNSCECGATLAPEGE